MPFWRNSASFSLWECLKSWGFYAMKCLLSTPRPLLWPRCLKEDRRHRWLSLCFLSTLRNTSERSKTSTGRMKTFCVHYSYLVWRYDGVDATFMEEKHFLSVFYETATRNLGDWESLVYASSIVYESWRELSPTLPRRKSSLFLDYSAITSNQHRR